MNKNFDCLFFYHSIFSLQMFILKKKEEIMNSSKELIINIYKDSEMGIFTVEQLSQVLNDKDNKIKPLVDDIYNQYKTFQDNAKQLVKEKGYQLEETGLFAKMGANMHIKKEVEKDNSDASIADMLIQGLSMGSIDMEKKLDTYKKEVSNEEYNLGKDFLKFQQKTIEDLKKFL